MSDSESTAPEQRPESVRAMVLALITAGLVTLSAILAIPYLAAITWAVALAIIGWPMHRGINRFIRSPRISAALSTLIVSTIIFGSGVFVTYRIASEANAATAGIKDQAETEGLESRLATLPVIGSIVSWLGRFDVNVEEQVRGAIQSYSGNLGGLAQGSVAAVVQLLVMVFILYYLLLDRTVFLRGIRDLLPLDESESDEVVRRAADTVHANLYATVITSLIDAVGGGVMFWIAGLPSPFVWGVVMFVLSLLPIVGAGIVWAPAALYLLLSGHWLGGAAILVWGVASFIVVDNIVYVRLVGTRLRMHPVLALIAFLGGLAVFGLAGMILGPAIVAVTMAFLQVWKQRMAARNGASVE